MHRARVTPKRSPQRASKFSIINILRSTPRSRRTSAAVSLRRKLQIETKKRDRVVETDPIDATEHDWFKSMLSLVKSKSSLEHRILQDPSGSIEWLEIIPRKCQIDKTLGPVKSVRLVVSTTKTYKVDVLYPIPRSIERL